MVDQKMDPVLKEIFAVAYRYRQKYQRPINTQQFWRNAAAEMELTAAQLHNHPFARALLVACYADIERELLASPAPAQPPTQQLRFREART